MTASQRVGFRIGLLILIILYVYPVFIGAFSALFGDLSGDSWSGRFFLSLMTSPTETWPILQKFLVPISAGLATVFLWSEARSATVVSLLVIAGIGLLGAAFLLYYLNDDKVAQDLWQVADLRQIQSAEQFSALKNQYLIGVLESLGTYVVVLFSIRSTAKES